MIGPILVFASGAILLSSTKPDWRSTIATCAGIAIMALGMYLTVTP